MYESSNTSSERQIKVPKSKGFPADRDYLPVTQLRALKERNRELEAMLDWSGHGQQRVASSIRNKFHHPDCVWALEISPENYLVYEDREEAIRDGLKPCQTCCA